MLRCVLLLFVLCRNLYAESCRKNIAKKFRKCLKDGYESELCHSSDSAKMADTQISSCQKVEDEVKNCDFECPIKKLEWREFTSLDSEATLVNGDETEVKFNCLDNAVFTIEYGDDMGNENFIYVHYKPQAHGMIKIVFCGFRQSVYLYPNSNTLKCKNGFTSIKILRTKREISIKSKSGGLTEAEHRLRIKLFQIVHKSGGS